mgnify:CR=1 FL=1
MGYTVRIMERQESAVAVKKFSSPKEEFSYLDSKLQSREELHRKWGSEEPKKSATEEVVREHRDLLPQPMVEEAEHPEAIHLTLSPEMHDQKMGELINVLVEQGAWRAMAVAEATKNAHLIDDFHRILSAYLSGGYGAKGLARGSELARDLKMALFELSLPQETTEEDQHKSLKELLFSMEQFYQGLLALPKDKNNSDHFTFEIANPVGSTAIIVYAAVPSASAELFEKQLTASFPKVRIALRPDDYNVFAENGYTVGSVAHLVHNPIFALKTYSDFESDPLNALLTAFSKLDREREGALIQFVIVPDDRKIMQRYHKALEDIRDGVPLKRAIDIRETVTGDLYTGLHDFFSPAKKKDPGGLHLESDARVKSIEKKLESPLMRVNLRLAASGTSRERAGSMLTSLEAAFKQFNDTNGNELSFTSVPTSSLMEFVRSVSYRHFEDRQALVLSSAEITALAHLPLRDTAASPELKAAKAAEAPAPIDLPAKGVIVGINRFRGQEREVRLDPIDRLRHQYVIGQTGTGKSVFLKNLIIQDIKNGDGVCFIDPHGSDVLEILSAVPPERADDVIYFDPGAVERPMGLNMLQYDARFPEQKSLVVDELLGIFKKLFGAIPESMGPAFEQYFRNAALLVMDDPDTGSTLLDIGRIFSDPAFRNLKLSRCKNPIVVAFWRGIALQAQGEQGLENYGPYVTSKFDVFTANDIMRPIIAQQHSSFDFRSIMDTKKILLVNLAKGRVGDINANLLGLIIVGKFLIAALSRTNSIGKDLPPFYLYIDEFQNFTTPSIATILSEARKYKLSLTIAHQFIAQLEDTIRDAVFGNVGSLFSLRVGADDAEVLKKQFEPVFTAHDLMTIDNYNAYARILMHGKPEKPFNISLVPFTPGSIEMIDHLKEMSYVKYGRDRAEVEAEIMAKYAPPATT